MMKPERAGDMLAIWERVMGEVRTRLDEAIVSDSLETLLAIEGAVKGVGKKTGEPIEIRRMGFLRLTDQEGGYCSDCIEIDDEALDATIREAFENQGVPINVINRRDPISGFSPEPVGRCELILRIWPAEAAKGGS